MLAVCISGDTLLKWPGNLSLITEAREKVTQSKAYLLFSVAFTEANTRLWKTSSRTYRHRSRCAYAWLLGSPTSGLFTTQGGRGCTPAEGGSAARLVWRHPHPATKPAPTPAPGQVYLDKMETSPPCHPRRPLAKLALWVHIFSQHTHTTARKFHNRSTIITDCKLFSQSHYRELLYLPRPPSPLVQYALYPKYCYHPTTILFCKLFSQYFWYNNSTTFFTVTL